VYVSGEEGIEPHNDGFTRWRVVLDEAQMIEGKFTAAATICDCLSARNRWCVTGTPIQREINDLHGLFSFLRHPQLSHGVAWRKIVKLFDTGDVAPFLEALRPLFWRHSKHHVDGVWLEASLEYHAARSDASCVCSCVRASFGASLQSCRYFLCVCMLPGSNICVRRSLVCRLSM
jgi:hypothetical protein